jgi:hypothetical protein
LRVAQLVEQRSVKAKVDGSNPSLQAFFGDEMANALSEIVAVLTQVKVATLIAEAVGIAVPPALTSFETTATAVLSGVENLAVPHSLSADLSDAATVAAAITPLLQNTSLSKIVTAIQAINATNQNLASGQLAIIGLVGASFDGVADKVIVAAYRESGAFAKLVDQGVVDSSQVA